MNLSGDAIQTFVLAGRAVFTVENPQTGRRYTFRVRRPKNEPLTGRGVDYFVDVLAGPCNSSDYRFIGSLAGGRFLRGRKVSSDCPSVRAFDWFWRHVADPAPAVVHHAGRCGRCARMLTVPESIQTGLGPECASKLS